ncbi:hypothetical protein AB751O23_CQ_00030 [Chlamydiales bacterium SCGC AB-751-O23]|nr:hypothetical protein AB751O23_CQ_00030 [Chlamydiales bacterium SCGC AB-751-O23]
MRNLKKTVAFCLVALMPFAGLSADETSTRDYTTQQGSDELAQSETSGTTGGAMGGMSSGLAMGGLALGAIAAAAAVSNAISSANDANAGHSH